MYIGNCSVIIYRKLLCTPVNNFSDILFQVLSIDSLGALSFEFTKDEHMLYPRSLKIAADILNK